MTKVEMQEQLEEYEAALQAARDTINQVLDSDDDEPLEIGADEEDS